jgi:hypothetical protein
MTSQQPKRGFPWRAVCVGANLVSLAAVVVWIAVDPDFARVLHWQRVELGLRPGADALPLVRAWTHFGWQLLAIKGLVALGALSGLAAFVLLFVGPSRQRGARAWLTLITLCSAWLALGTGWEGFAWWAKQQRLKRELPAFIQAGKLLENRWPGQDGELAGFGAYNAYPIGAPSTLMMLQDPTAPDSAKFALVERSPSGGLRFALSGPERGDWLEWHPAGHAPQSFTGGLEDRHELVRSAALGDGWHLARYQPDFGDSQ